MQLRASTLAAAGAAPLLLVLALTLTMTSATWDTSTTFAEAVTRSALVWAFLATATVAMLSAGWAWVSAADRAPRRLALGYTGALAMGMVVFVALQSFPA